MTAARSGARQSTDWRASARCRDVDPEIFFPVAEGGRALQLAVDAAKAVCADCPVRAECLGWARDALPYGIAGGQTPAERRGTGVRRDRRPRGTPDRRHSEAAAAGRAAIAAGLSAAAAARRFGVTERTALRWAAANRADTTTAQKASTA